MRGKKCDRLREEPMPCGTREATVIPEEEREDESRRKGRGSEFPGQRELHPPKNRAVSELLSHSARIP
jgi:hypothetical protein